MSGTGELNMRQGEILTILRQVFIHIKSIANFATTYIANTNKVSVHTFLSMINCQVCILYMGYLSTCQGLSRYH